jgi:hypothetical protein
MKRFFISMVGILFGIQFVYPQKVTFVENFDGSTVSFSSTPANAWTKNSIYFANAPYSYRGRVPHQLGDSIIFTSQVYNLLNYSHVKLRFNHICKISPMDFIRIEYKISSSGWIPLPASAYKGEANNYSRTGFNVDSYSEWENDSTVMPDQSWWKEEEFDLSYETGSDASVQFRFIIKRGYTAGTQVSYGWLLDNFEITAATYDLNQPIVGFISPLVRDTVYAVGPWEINARVKTTSTAPIQTPKLVYTSTFNETTETDTLLMTMVEGDSLWKVTIPALVAGTEVVYSITGKDANDNQTTASSSYVIAFGDVGYVVIGTETVAIGDSPINLTWEYSWSRQLYLATEFSPNAAGGVITKLAWDYSYNQTWNNTDQYCYFRVVDDVDIPSYYYEDPELDGATLVWQGTLGATEAGWVEIDLETPFNLPPGKNLMVYWNNKAGYYDAWSYVWNHSYTPFYSVAYGYSWDFNDAIDPNNWNLMNDYYRPNARFYVYNTDASKILDNSVALLSIDVSDTVTVAPGVQIPIVVTIKNKGKLNLDSITISYSINGNTPLEYKWKGNLSWDFNNSDTIGYYTPKLNGTDIITVSVSMPNGFADNKTDDDMLTKVIYGTADIQMLFVNFPDDTVFNTGPFIISARINTISGVSIGTASLNVATTNGTTTNANLSMSFDATDNLWKTTIPHSSFGSNIACSITLTDVRNNMLTIADSFYIKHLEGIVSDHIIIGTETTGGSPPANIEYSWSRQLYLATEFSPDAAGATITKLAWQYPWVSSVYCENQTCYFKAVDDIDISSSAYVDPFSDGADTVWSGTVNAFDEWIEITLDNPFVLPPGKNLLIYWDNKFEYWWGGWWNATQTAGNLTAYGESWQSFGDAANNGSLTEFRPNVRFETSKLITYQDTSVALVAIEAPSVSETVGSQVPIRVRIRNKGIKDLTYCQLNYSVNSIPSPLPVYYNRILPEDFTDTITIGTFLVSNQRNEIMVWVSNPNHGNDIIKYDDTLSFVSVGCSSLAGLKTVGGSNPDYPTLTAALTAIRECGMTGDLTLQLNGTFVGDIDLSAMNLFMNGYHLIITSYGNDPDNAIIQSTGTGIKLGNNRNITIQAITVDARTGTDGILFAGACTNIVIRDCKLLTDTSATYSLGSPIYKGGSSVADSIFIINNLLDGSDYGIFFNAGTNIVFDSNTVSNQYQFAVYPVSVHFTSCSYNTMLSRTTNVNSFWYGFFATYDNNGSIIGNRIIQRTAAIDEVYAMYLTYFNLTDTGMIANNEIIISGSGGSPSKGISVINSNFRILHNSIYISGTGYAPRGIELDGGFAEVKNNNIFIADATDGVPVHLNAGFSSNQHDLNNNNMYAPTYTGYTGNNNYVTTIAEWQQIVTTDTQSVRVAPNFTNPAINLELSPFNGMLCTSHPKVATDINNSPRSSITTFGAYTQQLSTQDLMLVKITPWKDRCIKGETLDVNVDVRNLCDATPVTVATLGWSINGITQQPYTWNISPALQPYQTQNITVGAFSVPDTANTFDVVIWVENLNGQPDLVKWNDTLSVSTLREPLAAFVSPFVADTINGLAFTVKVLIRTQTGAPSFIPNINLHTIINGDINIYDTIAMFQNGDIWEVSVPQQYYGSKVIYSVTVFDTLNNSFTITDTTFIRDIDGNNDKYTGYNLSILALTEPVTWTGISRSCPDEYLPLKIVLANLGENDYDFSGDNVMLTVEASNAIDYIISKTLIDGMLLSGNTDTIEVDPHFPVYMPGQYNIKVWLTSSIDHIPYDDTVKSTYTSERLGLPVVEDFEGGLSTEFTVNSVNTSAVWTVVSQGSGVDAGVLPQSGSDMLSFTGSIGALSHLVTRQLELRGTLLPFLQFWYFHDTIASEDYTDVFITTDGGASYQLLKTVYKQDTVYGWKQYWEDLTPYMNGQCINIRFEAMSFGTVTQYLDNISISSLPDLSVSEIQLSPDVTVCDLENKSLSVVLKTTTNHVITFPSNASLTVETQGSNYTVPLQGVIYGEAEKTVLVASDLNFTKGVQNVKAYLSFPVDNYPANDTAIRVIDVRPDLSVTVKQLTEGNSCFKIGSQVQQEIIVRNTGNTDLIGIKLILHIEGDNYTATVKENNTIDLSQGDTVLYSFINTYTVPDEASYQVQVIAYLNCDSTEVRNVNATNECADIHDVSIARLIHPGNQTDVTGSTEQIEVLIKNASDVKRYPNATITAVIEDGNGQRVASRVEVIPMIEPADSMIFTFPEAYSVPNDSVYYITVYLNSLDIYPNNDTLFEKRYTKKIIGVAPLDKTNAFTLGQNIPNPANNATLINYSVPEAGTVLFHVHSISGQLLYSKTIEAKRGNQSIELNTSTLAAGIYFYSIEYNSQRLVKRMSVK